MKNLPQPISTYVTRFIDQYNALNITAVDENEMSELIINCHFVPPEIFDAFLNLVKTMGLE